MGQLIDRLRDDCAIDFPKASHDRRCRVSPCFLRGLTTPLVIVFGVMIALPSLAAPLPASEFVVPGGPVITLQDGQRIDGHVVRLDQTNVIVLMADGREQTLPRAAIDFLRFETITGLEVEGALIGWKPGVYELTTDESVVTVYSMAPSRPAQDGRAGRAVAGVEQDEILGGALSVDETEQTQPDEDLGRDDAVADADKEIAATDDQPSSAEEPATNAQGGPPASIDQQLAAVKADTDLEISVSTVKGRENGAAVGFDFELSRPAESSVVLIYATIDGTAINGEDYEAARGVLVIKAGETKARIEAPVIDDDQAEDEEQLSLFLTVDPNVAVVKTRQITATIEDDDQS